MTIIIIITSTRPKPVFGRVGLARRIVGPGYSSSGYILGCSQRLALRLQRPPQIGYCCSNFWRLLKNERLKPVKDATNVTNKQAVSPQLITYCCPSSAFWKTFYEIILVLLRKKIIKTSITHYFDTIYLACGTLRSPSARLSNLSAWGLFGIGSSWEEARRSRILEVQT